MTVYAIYETGTGKVEWMCDNQGDIEPEGFDAKYSFAQISKQEMMVFQEVLRLGDEICFYNSQTGAVESRPMVEPACTIDKTQFLSDGIDAVLISNIPKASTVYINNANPMTIEDGEFELTVNFPGRYVITIEAPQYLVKEFYVNAT